MVRLLSTLAVLGVIAAIVGAVWTLTLARELDRISARGMADLTVAAARLTGKLEQYREMAVLMSGHPAIVQLATEGAEAEAVPELLTRTGAKTGARALHLAAADGRVLATTDAAGAMTGPAFRRAMRGALGRTHFVQRPEDRTAPRRIYRIASPVFGSGGRPVGAFIVDIDIATVEAAWRGAPRAVFVTDPAGVVFVANRSELVLRAYRHGSPADRGRFGYSPADLQPFFPITASDRAGHRIWAIEAGRYLPRRGVHLTLDLPVIGMQAELLADIGPALRLARTQALATAAGLLVLATLLALAAERRRALARQLATEAAATQRLEAEVASRTAELRAANEGLRREVAERLEAEAALKRAQSDLVQAGKLNALGQMSAGISHELNQPLMAIRSFAENAQLFLDRGKPDTARQNLGRIAEMARRMGRIIRNLRAFARQESDGVGDVDLVAVVETVLEMVAARIDMAGVQVGWHPPSGPVIVRGGEVRLQQVVANLVGNALDAMEGRDDRRLGIAIEDGPHVRLTVRDTGPGIADPDRVFEPFYSTKEVGGAEGMGLGLSISYGLVQSFGGHIEGRNATDGGAVFTVALLPGRLGAAA